MIFDQLMMLTKDTDIYFGGEIFKLGETPNKRIFVYFEIKKGEKIIHVVEGPKKRAKRGKKA